MDPVLVFRAITVVPLGLRRLGTGFMMGGQFKVQITFHPSVTAAHYEYRQFIKGTCFVTPGSFSSAVPSRASWSATASPYDAKSNFAMPGGLPTSFAEDAETAPSGAVRRFGYRTSPALSATGIEDRYTPAQATGAEYRALDTFGLRGTKRTTGIRIELHLHYMGQIVDTTRSNRLIRTLHWRFDGDDIIV